MAVYFDSFVASELTKLVCSRIKHLPGLPGQEKSLNPARKKYNTLYLK